MVYKYAEHISTQRYRRVVRVYTYNIVLNLHYTLHTVYKYTQYPIQYYIHYTDLKPSFPGSGLQKGLGHDRVTVH